MTTTVSPISPPAEKSGTIYNRVFWLSYAANLSLVCANALTFRFAEFVAYLGGTEQIVGAIVSVGMIGTLLARLLLGQAIDRYGTRKLWMLASITCLAGCGMFLASRDISWVIYMARVAFAIGLAGMFTCGIVHVQSRVPAHRRTEVIASLGSSGFLGIVAGAQLGDWILTSFPADGTQFMVLFGATAALGLFYLMLVVILTRNDIHTRPCETPAAHRLIFRYWPGSVALAAVMMGIGLTSTTVFLTRFATELNLKGVGTFFTGYALTAFVFRVWSRRWTEYIGQHSVILMGLAGHFVGNLVLPSVTEEWHFLVPAVVCGFGHALLFPVVLSVGSGAFPKEYRGSGTTIVLGIVELGAMLSAPVLGGIIDRFGFPAMFYTTSAAAMSIGILYAAVTHPGWAAGGLSRDETAVPAVHVVEDLLEPEQTEPQFNEPVSLPFPHLGRSA